MLQILANWMLFDFCKCDLTGNWFALTMITSIEHILFYFLFFLGTTNKKDQILFERKKKSADILIERIIFIFLFFLYSESLVRTKKLDTQTH